MTGRHARSVAVAAVVVLLLLVAHNLIWLVRNHVVLSCSQTLCTSPRDLEKAAAGVSNPKTRGQLAVFYYLAQRISGATLTVPDWMERYRWDLEHVARVQVVVSRTPLALDPARIPGLRAASTGHRRWLRRGGSESRRLFQDLYITVAPDVTDYVLAEVPGTYGPLFIVPRAIYEAAAR